MKNLIVCLCSFMLVGCNLPSFEDVPLDGEYAIPLINDKIKLDELLEGYDNLTVSTDQDGLLTLNYSASLFSESLSDLIPSISSIGEVPIIDTVSTFPLTTEDNFVITKALLSGGEMRFRYTHDKNESVIIEMRIPELQKDGKIFNSMFTLNAIGDLPYTEFTPTYDLNGYTYESDQNQLTFNYKAIDENGERIRLSFAAMSFNLLKFSYAEGNYERTIYDLTGDSLAVNVLSGWTGGSLDIRKPSISFDIDHTYGFPISVQINEVSIKAKDEVKNLESSLVNEEISLDFPGFSEQGQIASTSLTLDDGNSNLGALLNERIEYIDYDLTAIINPEDLPDIKGYATDESFFDLRARLSLPLDIKLSELELRDTIDLQKLFPDPLSEAEFKIVTSNDYPLELLVYFEFLDENGSVLERLLENEPLMIEPIQEETRFINLEPDFIEAIRNTKRIVVVSKFNTSSMEDDFVQLLSSQSLDLKVGLKFKL